MKSLVNFNAICPSDVRQISRSSVRVETLRLSALELLRGRWTLADPDHTSTENEANTMLTGSSFPARAQYGRNSVSFGSLYLPQQRLQNALNAAAAGGFRRLEPPFLEADREST